LIIDSLALFGPASDFRAVLASRSKPNWTQSILTAINTFSIVWAIVSVELTISWNKLTGVDTLNSTGQLIPFIIGIVALLQLFHGLSVERSNIISIDIVMVCFQISLRATDIL
jgi:hypothetical protein